MEQDLQSQQVMYKGTKAERGLAYTIYKGVKGKFGAFRLNPDFPSKEKLSRAETGCVVLEMSSPKGPNQYDWQNKVVFKLSQPDMAKIAIFFKGPSRNHSFCKQDTDQEGNTINSFSLYHDTSKSSGRAGAENKTLILSKASNRRTVMSKMIHKIQLPGQQEQRQVIDVPITADEAYTMSTLLDRAIYRILGW